MISLHAKTLLLRRGFHLRGPLVVGTMPGLVRVVALHVFEGCECIWPQVLLVNDPVVPEPLS
jgi:hypothetical protein